MSGTSKLVIVYHRQPYEEVVQDGKVVFQENSSPNGIVPTLKSFFGRVEQGTWVAWKRAPDPDAVTWPRKVSFDDHYGRYDVVRLPLEPDRIRSFYHVTSKEALWPILHSFPWQFSASNVDWDTFEEVNRRFAEAACAEAADDALIWVHDYNLWLVPFYVRQLKPKARIAFFHHTPFPGPDVFNILPWRDRVVDSLLACDLVGFHVPRYANNFAAVAVGLRGAKVTEELPASRGLDRCGRALSDPSVVTRLAHDGRIVRLDAWPVGTDPRVIHQLLGSDDSRAALDRIAQELSGQRLIVSIGRVDYVKGTKEMLQTYERLLSRRPELHGKVKLLVTSVKANKGMAVYRDARAEIEQLVGHINGRFSRLDWSPVLLFTDKVPFPEIVRYYKAADICWTTPLRDGLNLVAKEFVAAHEGNDGILILSEFTGVSVELPDAVLCNPYSEDSMDRAMDTALAMDPPEARRRARAMYEMVSTYDIARWAEHCFERFAELDGTGDDLPAVLTLPPSRASA
ncbi:MAG: glucosylglycerol-phosphate synthase [Alphaproteobacteria bacterium]|nr:glucosylglycerol-phosphate synthase [Alphaproteobacteria bacterium]